MPVEAPIPEDLVVLIQSGLSILVGTRDARLRPFAMRGAGLRVHEDRRTLDLFLPDATNAETLANVRANGRVAVTVSRASDHRSIQLKGVCTLVAPSSDEDHGFQKRYVELWANDVEIAGMPRSTTGRLNVWPSTCVRIEVSEIFDQTPGPVAGAKIEERRA